MAVESSPPTQAALVSAFVNQYYHVLRLNPEEASKFYVESSIFSRAEAPRIEAETVVTRNLISEKILSLDLKSVAIEVEIVDAQESLDGGFVAVVYGSFSKGNSWSKKFVHTLVVAVREGKHVVINDIFRHLDELPSVVTESDPEPKSDVKTASKLAEDFLEVADAKPDAESDNPAPVSEEATTTVVPETEIPAPDAGTDNAKIEPVAITPNLIEKTAVAPAVETTSEAAAPQKPKSYASILLAKSEAAKPAPKPTPPVRSAPKPAVNGVAATNGQNAVARAPQNDAKSVPPAVEGCGIFLGNLSMQVTAKEIEEAFKEFGVIRPNSIQIRKGGEYSTSLFGFLEFEEPASAQAAIAKGRVNLRTCMAHVEVKKGSVNNRAGGQQRGRYNRQPRPEGSHGADRPREAPVRAVRG